MSVFQTISPKDWSDSAGEISLYVYKTFILYPKFWTAYPDRVPTLNWKKVRFNAQGVRQLPDDKKGIYSFVAEPQIARHHAIGYLLYIGETHKQTLRTRCTSYLYEVNKKKQRVHIAEMLSRWPDHLWLHYAVIDDHAKIVSLEEDLLAAFHPPFNDDFPASVTEVRKKVLR
jgi:hypothetical protein